MSAAGARRWAARIAYRAARPVYGWVLRTSGPARADALRGHVARIRHRLPDLDDPADVRVPVPGDPAEPVVLVVATGADGARLRALRAHLAGCRARVVWVVDTDEPAVLSGDVVEWIPPRGALEAAGVDADEVLALRWSRLRGRYRPREVVVAAATGPLPDRALVGLGPRGEGPS